MRQGLPMKTPPARKLFAYWNERRGSRLAPERGDIEPGAIRGVLGDSFIVTFDTAAGHPFRLAGTRICALFGHELKGKPFLQRWDEASRPLIAELVAIVADEAIPVVAGVAARTAEGSCADLELLLLPLYHRGKTHVRLLGVLAPLAVPYWLGAERVVALTLGATRHLGAGVEAIAAPRLVRGDAAGRVRHGLTVYDGGLEN
ncbi:MAG TPA: PAS domain-containing protein [Xanthobacteraceae bacterium]|nr:PAS domain-containing protein [Xanthobacteraceae bacterium]